MYIIKNEDVFRIHLSFQFFQTPSMIMGICCLTGKQDQGFKAGNREVYVRG